MSDAKNANRNGVNEQSTHTHTHAHAHTHACTNTYSTHKEKNNFRDGL